jgi:group I intron endonuclease
VGDEMQVNEKTYVVYRHIFPNGKSYIGITCVKPYYYRWRAGSSYSKQPKIYKAIKKYGWENIAHEILYENLSQMEANRLEQEMINKFNSIINGYNISSGGGGSYGIPCSEEKKLKISRANKGKPGTNNFLRYISEHGAWNKGGHLTPEQYRKIVAERRARCNKAITAYDPITLRAVLHFDSCVNASKSVGVSKECISRCARGGRHTSAGYVWRYDNESI